MEARNGNPLNLQALITERNHLHGNIKNASRRLQYRLNSEASLIMVTADFLKDHRRDISVLVDKAVATNIQVGIMIKQLFPPGDQTPYRSFFWQTEEWEEKVLHDWATLAERIDGAVAEIQRIGEKGGQGSYQAIFPHFPSSPLISLASTPNQVEAASAFQLSTLLSSQKDQSSSTTPLFNPHNQDEAASASSILFSSPHKTLCLTSLTITQKRPQRKRIRSSLMMMVWPPTQKRILGCLQTIMENVKKHRGKMLREQFLQLPMMSIF